MKKYGNAVNNICRKEKITHILPLTDVEVDYFNKNRDYYIVHGICLCISPSKALDVCRNKKKQYELMESKIPEVTAIPTRIASECRYALFPFPVIAKPVDGRSSQGIVRIYSDEDWKAFIAAVQPGKYIIQPLLEGRIVTVDVVRRNDDEIVSVPRIELLRTYNGARLSVKIFSDKKLENKCRRLACALNVMGCVFFEFIVDDAGGYHYMECNPGFSAGVKFSFMAGYDFVTNHLRCFYNEPIDELRQIKEMYVARKYEEFITG